MDILSTMSPYIEQILTGLVSLITAIILAAFVELRKRVLTWIDSHNNLRLQKILNSLATQAFAEVENSMNDGEPGYEKMEKAISIVAAQLQKKGIKNFDEEHIKMAIEEAVLKFNYAYSN